MKTQILVNLFLSNLKSILPVALVLEVVVVVVPVELVVVVVVTIAVLGRYLFLMSMSLPMLPLVSEVGSQLPSHPSG